MKRILSTVILFTVFAAVTFAQRALMLKMNDGVTNAVPTTAIGEITFSEDGANIIIIPIEGDEVILKTANILDMSYGVAPANIMVKYDGEKATVENPYLLNGVYASVKGANVTVTNDNITTEYITELTGSTDNGSFIYNGSYKNTIVLNGVSITNTKGAAIDIECGKRVLMELKKGTVNTLVDAEGGKQKAALYCKGHLEIDKTGTLNVTGKTGHAISAKEYIQLKNSKGIINVLGAKKDGIHCGQYFLGNGFTVNIDNVLGDGIQAEAQVLIDEPYEEDYPNGSMTIQGGTYNIKVTADGMMGLKADADVVINCTKGTPNITISATGVGSEGIKAGVDGKITIDEAAVVKINE